MKESTIPAGEVLTIQLLKKVDKKAYQFGGFKTVGGIVKKTASNLDAKTIIVIPSKYIKIDINTFISIFKKTMNYYYFDIKFI